MQMHEVNSSHDSAAASPAKRLVVLGFQDCHCGQRAASHGCEGKLVRRAMRVDLIKVRASHINTWKSQQDVKRI